MDTDWETAPRISDVRFLPLIPRPGALWCVGLNYEDHRLETGRAKADYPTLFTRFPASLVGHGEALVRPSVSHLLDYEAELAVVIGRPGRHISEADALDHVAGYSCFNDASVRDYQGHSSQFGPGKNFWRTGGFGPFLVTPDEVPDPQDLPIGTRLNGEVVQASHTSQMTYPVRELIAYLSRIHPLRPGDVIATGTPSGRGRGPRSPALHEARRRRRSGPRKRRRAAERSRGRSGRRLVSSRAAGSPRSGEAAPRRSGSCCRGRSEIRRGCSSRCHPPPHAA